MKNLSIKSVDDNPRILKHYSPIDGNLLYELPISGENEVDFAMNNAKNALLKWRSIDMIQKSEILYRVADLLFERINELSELVRLETGKSESDAKSELEAAINFCRMIASYGRRAVGEILPSAISNRLVLNRRVEFGIAGLIVSYNTPLPNYAWKVFPALMGGNVVILKPSEYTSLSANLFSNILMEAGLPKDVLQVIIGDKSTAEIIAKAEIDLLSFTGSLEAGNNLSQINRRFFRKEIFELGGSNPIIVHRDANIGEAAFATINSAFSNSGQRCAAGSIVYVHKDISDSFKEILKKSALAYLDNHDIGCLITEKSVAKYHKYLEDCRSNDANVIEFKNPKQYYLAVNPSIVFELNSHSDLSSIELFAPCIRYFEFEDIDSCLYEVNRNTYALTAAIWSNDISLCHKLANSLHIGLVNINGPTFGSEPQFPFGGFRFSGNGMKDAGDSAILEYTSTKIVSTFDFGK